MSLQRYVEWYFFSIVIIVGFTSWTQQFMPKFHIDFTTSKCNKINCLRQLNKKQRRNKKQKVWQETPGRIGLQS